MKYVKIQKDGQRKSIEADRLERFLGEGWTQLKPTKTKKKPSAKHKITAKAEVINKPDFEEEILYDIEDIDSTNNSESQPNIEEN
jgi:hypothetical protein